MTGDEFDPKLARIPYASRARSGRYVTEVMRQAVAANRRMHKHGGHKWKWSARRGTGPGVRAAAGLIVDGGRSVIVRARYSIIGGDLGAARAHVRYIVRDGVSRDGTPGCAYDMAGEDVDLETFLKRSLNDPYQFRFMVSADDGARLADLRPFIRNLLAQMQHDLDTKLDWIAVDHFNTAHPHTHVVIRGRDDNGKDLVMAREYMTYGVRARARALVSLELGPESEMERLQKLINEVNQERFTLLDRSLLARSEAGVLAVGSSLDPDPVRQTLYVGRLKTLQRLGLAAERQTGVWSLNTNLERSLRQLGERADKFKAMQRALKEAGIDRGAAALALFERGPRQQPLLGRVVGVGMVDEITDRRWVAIDAVDGRIHYAQLGSLKPAAVPHPGAVVLLAGTTTTGKPSSSPQLHQISAVAIEHQTTYHGPTWLDQALLSHWRPDAEAAGFAAELRSAFAARLRWLKQRQLAEPSAVTGRLHPKAGMMQELRQQETQRLTASLARELGARYVAGDGARIHGIYVRSIITPTARLALIRRDDTFTLAPWRPALEPLRGKAVCGLVGPSRVVWTLDRGRGLTDR